jgi:hypothetical protein
MIRPLPSASFSGALPRVVKRTVVEVVGLSGRGVGGYDKRSDEY